jgi:tetratricopeptide (TPR) repeat protein
MLSDSLSLQEKINKLVLLYKKGLFKEALLEAKLLVKKNPNISIIHNIYGVINLALENWKSSIDCFSKAISIEPTYAEAYYNLGIAQDHLEQMEEAVKSYTTAVEIKSDLVRAHEALIHILSFYNPKKFNTNPCVKATKLLQKQNYNYNFEKKISDADVINFFHLSNDVIVQNINTLSINETEIFRNNTVDLKCERHFKVFNTFNIIPEYCFGCYKVQIEVKNVIELFKLYFIFDNLKLKNNNSRKCMVELRPKVESPYKGFIYCNSISEANEVYNQTNIALSKNTNLKTSIIIKRGCSEFGVAYPEYKKIYENKEQSMKYDKKWKIKEKKIDDQSVQSDNAKKRRLRNNLKGTSVCDILIMRNWVGYAKIIGDDSYKKIIEDVNIPAHIEKKLSYRLLKYKKETPPSPD